MLYDEYVLFQEEVASAAKEAIKEKNIQVILALLKDGFSIEKIADILKIEVDYALELAQLKSVMP
jgi:DNA-binding transcriptional MerR regulator